MLRRSRDRYVVINCFRDSLFSLPQYTLSAVQRNIWILFASPYNVPGGYFERKKMMLTAAERAPLIAKIRDLPAQLEALVSRLSDAQLDAHPAGEWSPRQNIHHLADSHMNAFMRVKLALTEDKPAVKVINQDAWAGLVDGCSLPVDSSLAILKGLHARWSALLDSLTEAQWARAVMHPERGELTVVDLLVMYARHGDNHIKQLQETLTRTAQ
jgi:hypothetical protein